MKTSDVRRALEFVRENCAPVTPERFVPQVIEGLFRLVSCEGVSCGIVDVARGEGSAVGYPADFFSQGPQKAISLGLPELTPRFQNIAGRFATFSGTLHRAEFHRSTLYNEYFRRRGVEDVAVLPYLDPSGMGSLFSVEACRDFSGRDTEMLNAIGGPLLAALSSASKLTKLEEEKGLLRTSLEAAGWNGLVVSHQEKVLLESPQARSLLVYYFGRDGGGDRRPDSLLRWMRAWANRQREPSAAPAQSTPFSVTRGGRRLVIRMLLHPSGYMLLLEEDDGTPPAARLRSLGLSGREAEVLSLIAEGKTGLEISILLDIRHDTVHKHTSRIFEKLGVETRTAAAAMALETTLGKRGL